MSVFPRFKEAFNDSENYPCTFKNKKAKLFIVVLEFNYSFNSHSYGRYIEYRNDFKFSNA